MKTPQIWRRASGSKGRPTLLWPSLPQVPGTRLISLLKDLQVDHDQAERVVVALLLGALLIIFLTVILSLVYLRETTTQVSVLST